jgi:hydroxymethylbilane synthase
VRSDATALRETLSALIHLPTFLAVHAERAVSRALGGSCSMPLAAHAVWQGSELNLRAAVGHPEDAAAPLLWAQVTATVASEAEARALGERAAATLRDAGAGAYLSCV